MKIKQLSANGYELSNIFDDAFLTELVEFVDNFIPANIRPSSDTPDMHAPPRSAVREVFHIDQISLKNKLVQELSKHSELGKLIPLSKIQAIEAWRDYPMYYNYKHYDDPVVGNVMIIYLDGQDTKNMGTEYTEQDQEYFVNYKKNNGIILFNSVEILHGMVGYVADVPYRKTLYFNWLTHD